MTMDWTSLLYWVVGGAAVIVAAIVAMVVVRGRRLFPTQVAITPTNVVHYTPQWVGRREQSIHMAHVASVDIDTNLFFSNVLIETSGGSEPVRCHGHRKRDAIEMKQLINEFQTAYYREKRV